MTEAELNKIGARLGSIRGIMKNTPRGSLRMILFEDMPRLIAEVRRLGKIEAKALAWKDCFENDDEDVDCVRLDKTQDELCAALEAP